MYTVRRLIVATFSIALIVLSIMGLAHNTGIISIIANALVLCISIYGLIGVSRFEYYHLRLFVFLLMAIWIFYLIMTIIEAIRLSPGGVIEDIILCCVLFFGILVSLDLTHHSKTEAHIPLLDHSTL